MSDFIEIHWSASSIDEARVVCRYLVQERLVACAQIVPWIESIYQWNNQLETSQESKVVLRTKKAFFQKIQEVIIKNSSYEVPEVTSFEIQEVNPSYAAWLEDSVLIDSKKII